MSRTSFTKFPVDEKLVVSERAGVFQIGVSALLTTPNEESAIVNKQNSTNGTEEVDGMVTVDVGMWVGNMKITDRKGKPNVATRIRIVPVVAVTPILKFALGSPSPSGLHKLFVHRSLPRKM